MVMDGQLGSFKSSGEIGGKPKEKKNNNVKSKMGSQVQRQRMA